MLLDELQTMASSLGISGTARMRKGELIAAIEQSQADGRGTAARAEAAAAARPPHGTKRYAPRFAAGAGRTPQRRRGEQPSAGA